jgi:23S rRNA (uracil1939-C5)-methyltransferase
VIDVVAITAIAAGGDGVGRLADGRAVFVPRTVPGERVRLRDGVKLHKSFARAELAEIVAAGGARVRAPCPHFARDRCGGCQLQHLAYEAQLAAKQAIVGDALRRIGKLELPDPEIIEAVEEWRYQTEITLAVGRPGPSGSAPIGFAPYDRRGHVFPLSDCHIADRRLMALWLAVKQHQALLPPGLMRLTLRLDREGRRHVIAESPGEPWHNAAALRGALGGGGGGGGGGSDDVICWWQPVDGAARVLAGAVTGFAPTAFEPANPEMATIVRHWAVEQLGDMRGAVVWDLYGGIGDTAAELAARGAEVVSVDADEKAIAWARGREAARPIRFIAGSVEDVLPTLPEPVAVVVAPPQTGLAWNVTLRLTAEPVGRLVYRSSDPATLARDLQRLSVNYEVTAVRAFDRFPQTARVETVALLTSL